MGKFSEMSGISKGYISMLERNRTQRGDEPAPSIETYRSAAAAMNIDLDDLIRMVDGKIRLSNVTPLPADAFPINPTHKIPLLGQIAAGSPIYADENVEGYIWTDHNHGAEYFGLRVRGDSMNAAGIRPNDIVIVRRQDMVEEGDIAVVLVDDSATIKRYRQEGKTVILSPQSTNPENRVQIYSLKEHIIKVLGKVVESRTSYI
jgi:repressor LexA